MPNKECTNWYVYCDYKMLCCIQTYNQTFVVVSFVNTMTFPRQHNNTTYSMYHGTHITPVTYYYYLYVQSLPLQHLMGKYTTFSRVIQKKMWVCLCVNVMTCPFPMYSTSLIQSFYRYLFLCLCV